MAVINIKTGDVTFSGRVYKLSTSYNSSMDITTYWADVFTEAGAYDRVYLRCDMGEPVAMASIDATPSVLAQMAILTRRAQEKTETALAVMEAAKVRKGRTVEVVKGRKVAHGVKGVCFWVGSDNWGAARIGFKDAGGVVFWIAASNVAVIA